MIDMNQPQWYIIYTNFGYDNIVKDKILLLRDNSSDLQDRLFDAVCIEDEEIVDKNGKKKVVIKKRFPNYVFVKMIYSNDLWYLINSINGVNRNQNNIQKPLPMQQDEVKRIQLEQVKVEDLDIKVGDAIKILSGPLEGFIGDIQEIKLDQQKVKVTVEMFGRVTPVELEFNQIEKI